jgi:hypothetical protein
MPCVHAKWSCFGLQIDNHCMTMCIVAGDLQVYNLLQFAATFFSIQHAKGHAHQVG